MPLHAYFDFWERLGAHNSNISMDTYLPSGSRTLQTNSGVPDDMLREAITDALDEDTDGVINVHGIDLSVHEGTVLREGFQKRHSRPTGSLGGSGDCTWGQGNRQYARDPSALVPEIGCMR